MVHILLRQPFGSCTRPSWCLCPRPSAPVGHDRTCISDRFSVHFSYRLNVEDRGKAGEDCSNTGYLIQFFVAFHPLGHGYGY